MYNHFHTWICILCATYSYTCFAKDFTITNTTEWQNAISHAMSGDSLIISGNVTVPAGTTSITQPIEITTSNNGKLLFPQTALLQFEGQSTLPGTAPALPYKITNLTFEAAIPTSAPSYFIKAKPGTTIRIGNVSTNSQGGFIDDQGADYIQVVACHLKHSGPTHVIASKQTRFLEIEHCSIDLGPSITALVSTSAPDSAEAFLKTIIADRKKPHGGTQAPIIRLNSIAGKVAPTTEFVLLSFHNETAPMMYSVMHPELQAEDSFVQMVAQIAQTTTELLPLYLPIIDIQNTHITSSGSGNSGYIQIKGPTASDATLPMVSVFAKNNYMDAGSGTCFFSSTRGTIDTPDTFPIQTHWISFEGIPSSAAPGSAWTSQTIGVGAKFIKDQAELDWVQNLEETTPFASAHLLYPNVYNNVHTILSSSVAGVPINGKNPCCSIKGKNTTYSAEIPEPFFIISIDFFNTEEMEQPLLSSCWSIWKDSTFITSRSVLEILPALPYSQMPGAAGLPRGGTPYPWLAAAILENVSCYFLPSSSDGQRYFIKTPGSMITELTLNNLCIRNTEAQMNTCAFHMSPSTEITLSNSLIDVDYLLRQTECAPFIFQGHELVTYEGGLFPPSTPSIAGLLRLNKNLIHVEKAVMEITTPSSKNDLAPRKKNLESVSSSFASIPNIYSLDSLIEIGDGIKSCGIVKIVPSGYFNPKTPPLFSAGSVIDYLPLCYFAVQDPLLTYAENGQLMTSKEVPFLVYLSTQWEDLLPQLDPIKIAKDLGISLKVGDALLPSWHKSAEVQPWVEKVLAGDVLLPPSSINIADGTSKIAKAFLSQGNVYKNPSLQLGCHRGLSSSEVQTKTATAVNKLGSVSLIDDPLNSPVGASMFNTKDPLVTYHSDTSPFVSGDFSKKYRIFWEYTGADEVLYFGLFFDSTLVKKISFVPGKVQYEVYIQKTDTVTKHKDRLHIKAVLK